MSSFLWWHLLRVHLARPAAGAEAVGAAGGAGGGPLPGVGPERATPPDACADGLLLGRGLRAVDPLEPVRLPLDGPVGQRHGDDRLDAGRAGPVVAAAVAPVLPAPEAGPPPVLGPGGQPGPQGVALDVAGDDQKWRSPWTGKLL
jgi:hypothetical protein